MATANDILKVAKGEIGYTEGANNNNKYGVAYGWNNVAWCVQFVWWCFYKAKASALFYGGGRIASCSKLYSYHKTQKVSTSSLRPGDIVFFDFSGKKADTDHVGIVESVSGSTITTIEGNTSSGSSGSQANGDGVYRRKRNLKYITCAYRPAYDGVSNNVEIEEEDTVDITLSVLSKGSEGDQVKTVQRLLSASGYKLGKYGIDGDFGDDTEDAVIAFQKARGLEPDGVVGKDTWTKLLKG